MSDKDKLVFFIFDYTKSMYSLARIRKTLAFGFYIPEADKFVLADEILPRGAVSDKMTKRILEHTFKEIVKSVKEGQYFLDYPGREKFILFIRGETGELLHQPFDPEEKELAYQICSKECLKTQQPVFVITENEQDLMRSILNTVPKKTIDVFEGMTFIACIPVNDPRLVKFFKGYLPLLDKIYELREELRRKKEKAKKEMANLSGMLPSKNTPLLGMEGMDEGEEIEPAVKIVKLPFPPNFFKELEEEVLPDIQKRIEERGEKKKIGKKPKKGLLRMKKKKGRAVRRVLCSPKKDLQIFKEVNEVVEKINKTQERARDATKQIAEIIKNIEFPE